MHQTIKVAIADDHAVVRTGYRRLLELEPDVEVVAEFGDCESTYNWFLSGWADILILDLSMPGRGGLETLRRLKTRVPELKILVFSMYDTPSMVSQAMQSGADGYLTKSSPPESLVNAVLELASGGRPLSDDAACALAQADGDGNSLHQALSPREFEVFRMLAQGLTVEEIAARLFVSTKTVANYQTMIRQKTGLATSLEMFRYAQARRLLD